MTARENQGEMFDEIVLTAWTTDGATFVVTLHVTRMAPWRIVVPTGPMIGEYADGDLFDALRQLRRRLDADGTLLLCVGARADVWPSTASREVFGGRKVARLRFGETVDASLDIFDEDTEMPESVAEQDEFRARWTRAFGEPPVRALGTWIPLDEDGRKAWLDRARDVYFLGGRTSVQARGPGTTIDLDVSAVTELTSFLCALGEAVNGPGGYFGVSLRALEDCLVGGFGMTPPWTLRVSDVSRLAHVLDAASLERRASARIAAGDFLDEEGRSWLENARDEGRIGQRTLWDEVRKLFIAMRVTLVDCAAHGTETLTKGTSMREYLRARARRALEEDAVDVTLLPILLELRDAGMQSQAAYEVLLELRATIQDEMILDMFDDVLDRVSGFCSVHQRIWP